MGWLNIKAIKDMLENVYDTALKALKILRAAKTETLVASAARTTSGSSTAFDVSSFKEADFFLNVTGVPAVYTDETLDVAVETQDPVSGEWLPLTAFTQITSATTKERKSVIGNLGSKIRITWTIGGTAPDYTFSVGAVLKS